MASNHVAFVLVLLLGTAKGLANGYGGRGGGRGGYSRGGRGGGRGGYSSISSGRGGRGGGAGGSAVRKPRYTPPTPGAADERNMDLFGPPGEWRARKGAREWLKYGEDNGVEGWAGDGLSREHDVDTSPAVDDLAPPADFAPKMWSAEAGGGKKAKFFDDNAATFVELGASDELQAALEASGAGRPSHVQALGFGPIASGDDVALADQTGSGKTIAYLAPIVQHLRQAEETLGRAPGSHVRALVLTPTSELAQQVLSVAKALSANGVPFRSSIITGEHKWRTQAKCAQNGLELLIATPGRLAAHVEEGSFSLAMASRVVLDEADLLFEDEDFEETWQLLRERLPDTASTAFVTATMPDWLIQRVQEELPLVQVLKGRNLHRTGVGVQETIVDCSAGERVRGDGDTGFRLKAAALTQQLAEHPSPRVLIFCNTIESCRRVENFLRRKDKRGERFEVFAFHGAIPAEVRKRTLAAFTEPVHMGGVPRLLVCTDRASRGMDFKEVGHVLLFDFPRDGVEYVRRVGRATRGGRTPGRVSSLVLGRQLGYARELMKINREGGAVDLDVHGSSGGGVASAAEAGPSRGGDGQGRRGGGRSFAWEDEDDEPWKANWKERR